MPFLKRTDLFGNWKRAGGKNGGAAATHDGRDTHKHEAHMPLHSTTMCLKVDTRLRELYTTTKWVQVMGSHNIIAEYCRL